MLVPNIRNWVADKVTVAFEPQAQGSGATFLARHLPTFLSKSKNDDNLPFPLVELNCSWPHPADPFEEASDGRSIMEKLKDRMGTEARRNWEFVDKLKDIRPIVINCPDLLKTGFKDFYKSF